MAHVASGAGLAMMGLSWAWAVALLVGFEVVEAGLRRIPVASRRGLFEDESWPNVAADIVLGMGGFGAVRALPSR